MYGLDYSDLTDTEAGRVDLALSQGRVDLVGYLPEERRVAFVLRNFQRLSELKALELTWMQTYFHASHLNDVSLDELQVVFDTCDKAILQKHYPIPPGFLDLRGNRYSLFRGCAGPDHRMGMSWSPSLSKAIWYAAHHAQNYKLSNVAVYAAVVDPDEIYCCASFYDYDFIVRPKEWWPIPVPAKEFRVDRIR